MRSRIALPERVHGRLIQVPSPIATVELFKRYKRLIYEQGRGQ